MNFLAHLHVSPDLPGFQLGSVLADLIKGPSLSALPPAVQAGVRLHRHVDAFTDRHPVVARAVGRVSAKWGWFSGIILDIYFDYLLARTWSDWSAEPLRSFADRMYDVLETGLIYLAIEPRQFLAGLIQSDRLVSYGTEAGLTETLARTAVRIAERMPTRALPLAEAVPQLQELEAILLIDFQEFYPMLRADAAREAVSIQSIT